MGDNIWSNAGWILSALGIALALGASGHALVRKRDPRSSLWWVSLNLFLPYLGPLLYYLFGINRIERKAYRLRRRVLNPSDAPTMVSGNRIVPLFNGDAAYPAMLKHIDGATASIGLASYIFNRDHVGRKFVDALGRAVHRGVEVRVLVDDVGDGFFWNSVQIDLDRQRVRNTSFLPTFIPWKLAHMNLRNHRKILTIDGKTAFTGGMNIAGGDYSDIHFQIEGPVVTQIQDAFRTDWQFMTSEILKGPAWFPALNNSGTAQARAIPDGPDENVGKTRTTIIEALAKARKSVRIMTPYFLPDAGLITALQMVVLGGVRVDVVVPQAIDWQIVQWASKAMMWQVLEIGCHLWETPPPFHHGKLMIVDDEWVMFGSSNWDARSLRLNFEFNMECRDKSLADNMTRYFEQNKLSASEISLADVDQRSLPIKLRDGFARLFTPIL